MVPEGNQPTRHGPIKRYKKIVFVCAVGQRSALAAEMAAAAGLPADHLYTLDGGTDAWRKAGETIET
jgi:rhodanese-related sulfurtransferase